MPAQGHDPPEALIQALHDRYLLEVVEDLGLCPFARRCREQGRVARPLFYAPEDPDGDAALPDELAASVSLGMRVDRYLALVAAGNADEPAQLWNELHDALRAMAGL